MHRLHACLCSSLSLALLSYYAMHRSIISTQQVELRTLRPYTSWKNFQKCLLLCEHRFSDFCWDYSYSNSWTHTKSHFFGGRMSCIQKMSSPRYQLFEARGQCDLPILCEAGKESWKLLGHRCGPMDSLRAWGPPGTHNHNHGDANNDRNLKQNLVGAPLDQQ